MADVIKFSCKSCGRKIAVRSEYAGKKAKCPGCKAPLRVPSPRPARSSTGVPIAAGAAASDTTHSGPSSKSYSLADLAEMEANADAELKELSHKSRPNNIRIPNGKDCPDCGASCQPNAVICVECGHSFDGGKKLKTKKDSKMGNAMRSVAASLGEEDEEGESDFWKYAVPTGMFVVISLLCFTGLAGKITEGIPLELAESVNGLYNDMGPVGSGGLFLGLGALSGGIWWLMKR